MFSKKHLGHGSIYDIKEAISFYISRQKKKIVWLVGDHDLTQISEAIS